MGRQTFSGIQGAYVPIKDTLRSFKTILSGEVDHIPEQAFLFCATIDDVLEKDPGFYGWMMQADFTLDTKRTLTAIKLRKLNGKM